MLLSPFCDNATHTLRITGSRLCLLHSLMIFIFNLDMYATKNTVCTNRVGTKCHCSGQNTPPLTTKTHYHLCFHVFAITVDVKKVLP